MCMLDRLCMCRAQGACDEVLQRFAAEVNGPLMVALAEKVSYHDVDSVELFRKGGPLVGKLTRLLQFACVGALFRCVCALMLDLQDRKRRAPRSTAKTDAGRTPPRKASEHACMCLLFPVFLKLITLQAQDEQSSAGRPKGGHSVVRVLAGGMPR